MASKTKRPTQKNRATNKVGPHVVGQMYLKHDWSEVLRHAWSVRFMAAAVLLTGFEAGLPFLKELGLVEWLPGGIFALSSCLVVMAALWARLVAQHNLGDTSGC